MLILPIKKEWFNMILSGKKKEEYREPKPYYTTRFKNVWNGSLLDCDTVKKEIVFRNGYNKNSPSFIASCTLDIGTGKEEWGAEPSKKYYILRIHEITERKNC